MPDTLMLPAQLLAAHAIVSLAAGLCALLLGFRGARLALARPSRARAVAAPLVAALAAVLAALALFPYGVGFFGLLHLWTVDLLVVAPALAAAFGLQAVGSRRDDMSRAPQVAIAGLLCVAALCAAWGRFIEPTRLVLEAQTVVTGQLSRALRIGVLADLQTAHVTDYEQRAVSSLLAEAPDLIVVPGDLFQASHQRFEQELPKLRSLLARLTAPLGVFAVIGNTDIPHEFVRTLEGTGIVWLHNQTRELETDFGTIVISGLGYYDRPELLSTYRAAGVRAGPGRLSLVVAHDAGIVWARGVEHESDLLVAGHTHGGQVRLPILGALLTLSRLPARYAAGLHPLGAGFLYVSRGVGVERAQAPRIRFLCPPEITVITVVPRALSLPVER